MRMDALGIIPVASVVFFGSSDWALAALGVLHIAGLWLMFKKSGISPAWALLPWVREYMLAKCGGREQEGRIAAVAAFLASAVSIGLLLYLPYATPDITDRTLGFALELIIVQMVLALVLVIYRARVGFGLVEVYGVRRLWVVLWAFLPFVPALVWGASPKYRPAWKVDEIRRELAAIASYGTVASMDGGLTVDLDVRTVNEFMRKKILLRDIHLSIPAGHMVLLLGGSGSGKTVLLNAISGYEKADARITLGGSDMYRHYKKMQYQVGYVPQQDTIRGRDTILNTLLDAAKLRMPKEVPASDRRARVDEVMDIFGLTPSKTHLIQKLSGGQRKRVSIAMELISNPSLFILDEPDSGLDGVMARELMTQLRKIADQGKIVIVITHTPDRVIDLFDDVIVLARDSKRVGRLAFYGSTEETRAFFGTESMEEIVKMINPTLVGGEGRADEFIAKYAEVQHA